MDKTIQIEFNTEEMQILGAVAGWGIQTMGKAIKLSEDEQKNLELLKSIHKKIGKGFKEYIKKDLTE